MTDVNSLIEPFGRLLDDPGPLGEEDGMDDKVWYLKHNRLFAQATDQSIENCEHLFRTTLFPRRSLVFDQGDPTRIVYLIKRGKVRIGRLTTDGKEVTVAILGAGDIFGAETLFDDGPRTTIATCMEESLLCTARADDLFALLSQDPKLALNVASVLSTRLGDASAAIEDLAYARVPDRIMHLFLRLAAEHGVETPSGDVRIDLRLTHAEIASLVGSTRETVSVEIAGLQRGGRLSTDGVAFTIPKAELGAA